MSAERKNVTVNLMRISFRLVLVGDVVDQKMKALLSCFVLLVSHDACLQLRNGVNLKLEATCPLSSISRGFLSVHFPIRAVCQISAGSTNQRLTINSGFVESFRLVHVAGDVVCLLRL